MHFCKRIKLSKFNCAKNQLKKIISHWLNLMWKSRAFWARVVFIVFDCIYLAVNCLLQLLINSGVVNWYAIRVHKHVGRRQCGGLKVATMVGMRIRSNNDICKWNGNLIDKTIKNLVEIWILFLDHHSG